jgi:hypothetical protein
MGDGSVFCIRDQLSHNVGLSNSIIVINRDHFIYIEGNNAHPSEGYLRGALWLGRNLAMVIEELAEGLDYFRSKYLTEVIMHYIGPS